MSIPEGMEEVFDEFLLEAAEILERIDAEILELERSPGSQDLVASIFRGMHTIKGAAGFLELGEIQEVAHDAENLLSAVRDGKTGVDQALTTELLSAADRLRQLIRQEIPEDADAYVAVDGPADAANPMSTGDGADLGSDSIRVDIGVLDELLALSGELILNRNQLRAGLSDVEGPMSTAVKSLTMLTSQLQQAVMRARMQPIRHAWGKFPRMVRDMSLELGKDVELELHGEATELDRGLLEPVKDALTHILRNALDHGIETPDVRRAAGKPPRGKIVLSASHRSGFVNVEVSDNGQGINTDAVKAAALRKGLITAEQADTLSYDEAIELLFLPGFSTAQVVGNLSGRGVGMDVVKTEVERIGGAIQVHSAPGQGTTITIEIPLTLIGIPALILTVGAQHFAFTRSSVLQLAGDDQFTTVAGRPAVRYDNELLPVVDIAEALGIAHSGDSRVTVVCEVDGRRIGFRAGEIAGIEEIVVKQLDPLAAGSGLYTGVSVLGSGVVTLIIDLPGLLNYCDIAELPASSSAAVAVAEDDANLVHAVLCRRGEKVLAFPAEGISRIEELDAATTATLDSHGFVAYRGGILRILEPYGISPCDHEDNERLSLVVLRGRDRDGTPMSLRIDELVDIAHMPVVGPGRTPLVHAVASSHLGLVEVLDLAAIKEMETTR